MKVILFALFTLVSANSTLHAAEYLRATEDPDNVKRKEFPKKKKIELDLPDVGIILNQAFINTFLVHGGITYFKNEEWGYGIEASMAMNQDKAERECLETFYNDPDNYVDAECAAQGDEEKLSDAQISSKANYGPAYMPIREIRYIIAGNLVWNPVYGKQLVFMGMTNHFDVFLTMGAGLVFSDYYAQRNDLENGRKARATLIKDESTGQESLDGGASPSETNSYGAAGRPLVEQQTHPFINLGVGQKYHFMDRFSVKFEFRNMTLIGTPNGFENLIAVWAGLGTRF